MHLRRTSTTECYSFLQNYQNRAYHAEFVEEYRKFCERVTRVIESCKRSVDDSGWGANDADFDIPPDTEYPDDRVLVLVTFRGRRITPILMFELASLVIESSPSYHIFIDGQVSHGKSFEIVLCPNGEVLGAERDSTQLLTSLGFPSEESPQNLNQEANQAVHSDT